MRRRVMDTLRAVAFLFCFLTASGMSGFAIHMISDEAAVLPPVAAASEVIIDDSGEDAVTDLGRRTTVAAEAPDVLGSILLYGEEYVLDRTAAGTAYYRPVSEEALPGILEDLVDEARIDLSASPEERFRRISGIVSEKLEYDDEAAAVGGPKEIGHDPWTFWCLVEGKATCSGYVEVVQALCEASGMECWYATGDLYLPGMPEPQLHAWCLVRLPGGRSFWHDPVASDSRFAVMMEEELPSGYEGDALCRRYRVNGRDFPHEGRWKTARDTGASVSVS